MKASPTPNMKVSPKRPVSLPLSSFKTRGARGKSREVVYEVRSLVVVG